MQSPFNHEVQHPVWKDVVSVIAHGAVAKGQQVVDNPGFENFWRMVLSNDCHQLAYGEQCQIQVLLSSGK